MQLPNGNLHKTHMMGNLKLKWFLKGDGAIKKEMGERGIIWRKLELEETWNKYIKRGPVKFFREKWLNGSWGQETTMVTKSGMWEGGWGSHNTTPTGKNCCPPSGGEAVTPWQQWAQSGSVSCTSSRMGLLRVLTSSLPWWVCKYSFWIIHCLQNQGGGREQRALPFSCLSLTMGYSSPTSLIGHQSMRGNGLLWIDPKGSIESSAYCALIKYSQPMQTMERKVNRF